jgi:hypothetical protein
MASLDQMPADAIMHIAHQTIAFLEARALAFDGGEVLPVAGDSGALPRGLPVRD